MAKRHWEFDLEDGHHVVDLVHGYFLGTRTFVVDGAKTVQRTIPFTNHSGEHPFPLPAHDARVRITTNGLKYFYDLVVDGREIRTGDEAGAVARPRMGGPGSERFFGAIIVLIAIPTLAFFGKSGYDEYRYHTASATAVGTVQDKRVVTGRYGDSYRLTYLFLDKSAATHRGSDDVSRATYNQARPGSTYTVRYLPDEPGINRFSGKDDTLLAAGFITLGAGGLAFGAYMLVTGHKRLAAVERINNGGEPVSATVTKLRKTQLQHVGKTVTIEYEYDDSFGRRRRGRGPLMYPAEAARYTVGGPVRVLIDPDRPGDSLLP